MNTYLQKHNFQLSYFKTLSDGPAVISNPAL